MFALFLAWEKASSEVFYFPSVNTTLSSVNDNHILVNQMVTCLGCDYSHHQADVYNTE